MTWHASSQLLMHIDLLNVAPPPSPDSVLGSVPISRTSRHHAPAPATASPPVVSSAPSRNATAKVQTGPAWAGETMICIRLALATKDASSPSNAGLGGDVPSGPARAPSA
eukprot:CAMPEP_0181380300 /NCGR_PEP_ID=MMETSP1106-20121128/19470_1 /TAXON_ID=81844 /ORGANISM="Mantoniella antarctica, Strain SL-175" /LENGTH=109 /DNA_ID=CAMNT_0023499319 /DNA_START=338 /DNA_END=664 /DNA_ORIENTATION=-